MNWRLPSLTYLYQQSFSVMVRFPGAILSALIGVLSFLMLIELGHDYVKDRYEFLVNLGMVALLGISLLTTVKLICEHYRLSQRHAIVWQIIAFLPLVAYYFSLPTPIYEGPFKHIVRYVVIAAGLHFLVAFAPYIKKGSLNGFWQYNRVLFLRFLTAILYSGVLYIGLCLALLAIDKLLGINIDEKLYLELWVAIAGLFNTWFFLAGIPHSLQDLEETTEYPTGLKIFTQYVLLPLVVIYLAILYLYMAKIIINWSWPEGWIGILVLSFAIAGILALLLVYPIRKQRSNRWIQRFSHGYYIAMLPLVVLLLLAIWRRVTEYSFTENRYYVLVLALWLGAVSIYFIVSNRQNIKVIPTSLCLIAFLSCYGPWSAFQVAQKSQLNRLESMLVQHDILVDGKIQKVEKSLSFEDKKAISSTVYYLVQHHGAATFKPWLSIPIDSVKDQKYTSAYTTSENIMQEMGLDYVSRYRNKTQYYTVANYYVKDSAPTKVSGYQYATPINSYISFTEDTTSLKKFQLHDTLYELKIRADRYALLWYKNQQFVTTFDISATVDTLRSAYPETRTSYQVPAHYLRIQRTTPELSFALHLSNLRLERGEEDSEGPVIKRMEGLLLLKEKKTVKEQ
jgi:hypothetical protein